MVRCYWKAMSGISSSTSELLTCNTSKTFVSHHSGYSGAGNLPAHILQLFGDLRTSIPAFTIDIHSLYLFLYLIVFQLSAAWLSSQPGIITTTAYLKHQTHLLNTKLVAVVLNELQYWLSPLEKMLTAFFRISRSI